MPGFDRELDGEDGVAVRVRQGQPPGAAGALEAVPCRKLEAQLAPDRRPAGAPMNAERTDQEMRTMDDQFRRSQDGGNEACLDPEGERERCGFFTGVCADRRRPGSKNEREERGNAHGASRPEPLDRSVGPGNTACGHQPPDRSESLSPRRHRRYNNSGLLEDPAWVPATTKRLSPSIARREDVVAPFVVHQPAADDLAARVDEHRALEVRVLLLHEVVQVPDDSVEVQSPVAARHRIPARGRTDRDAVVVDGEELAGADVAQQARLRIPDESMEPVI